MPLRLPIPPRLLPTLKETRGALGTEPPGRGSSSGISQKVFDILLPPGIPAEIRSADGQPASGQELRPRFQTVEHLVQFAELKEFGVRPPHALMGGGRGSDRRARSSGSAAGQTTWTA